MELEKIIRDMREQGADDEQILQSLQKMVEEGKLAPEDFEKAKEILMGDKEGYADRDIDEQAEKKEAEKLFGMKLI